MLFHHDFVLKKGDQTIKIPSLVVRDKIKAFNNENPNSLHSRSRVCEDSSSNQNNTIFEYEIQTEAPEEIIKSFFATPVTKQFPEFNETNVDIYHQLAYEFEYEEFQNEIDKFNLLRPDLSNFLSSYISNSENEIGPSFHEYESKIAENFDFYIQNEECRKKIIEHFSLSQIHRILTNEKCKIENHMKFYQFLKEFLNSPHNDETDDEIGLLLQFVDFKQLKGPSIEDFISMSERYHLHIPGLNSTLHEQLKEMKQNINELREQVCESQRIIQEQQTTISQLIETYNETTKKFNKMEHDIKELREQNGESQKTIQEQQTTISQLIETNNETTKKFNKIKYYTKKLREENKQITHKIRMNKVENNQFHTEIESRTNQKIDGVNQQLTNLNQNISDLQSDLRVLQENDDNRKEHERSIDDTNQQHSSAINEIQHWLKTNKPLIEQLPTKNEETQKHFETQNQLNVQFNQQFNGIYSLFINQQLKVDETNGGIFSYLRGMQTNEFEPLFYTSQSSGDFYEMMNWDSVHLIGGDESGSFWHEFKFEETIHFSGIKLKSPTGCYPRSFDIKINDEVVYSTKDATELNGQYKEMTIQFEEIKEGNIVRIEQTGDSCNNSKRFYFSKIELYSTDEKYKGGVFKSLMKRYGNDPHKIHVLHSSKNFDHNSFHNIDANTNICTFDGDDQYFEIEFSKGRMSVNGMRIQTIDNKEFLLKGSNNKALSNEEWETIKIKEPTPMKSHNNLWFYEVESSTPYKYFRIMKPLGKGRIKFYHLDFFGSYLTC